MGARRQGLEGHLPLKFARYLSPFRDNNSATKEKKDRGLIPRKHPTGAYMLAESVFAKGAP